MKFGYIAFVCCLVLGSGCAQSDFKDDEELYIPNDDEYDNSWMSYTYIAKYVGEYGDLEIILSGYMYHVVRNVTASHYILGSYQRSFRTLSLFELQAADAYFLELYRERRTIRHVRSTLPQWNVVPSVLENVPSMNIDAVWSRGYTGNGVTINIIDDGIDSNHIELMDNHNETLDFDYAFNRQGASHSSDDVGHGTWMAGIIAAANNDVCVTGIAHGATFTAQRILEHEHAQSSSEARAFTDLQHIADIYSCGFGPEDNGVSFSKVDQMVDITAEAMRQVITQGRNGKGAIFVWAAGNGGKNFDDCNVDGYVNSVYTIAINALKADGEADDDAEECSVVMAATFASAIPSTAPDGQCISSVSGSSAGGAVASAIIALILEANPDLTWRDVQHIIVETSVDVPRSNSDITVNAAGKMFSPLYGFGAMDAVAMLNAALNWTTVRPYLEFYGPFLTPDGHGVSDIGSTESVYELTDCPVNSIEHVVVYIVFRSAWREFTSIYLTSPSNTESRLLRERSYDYQFTDVTWYFTSLAFWGEEPTGTWTLRMDSSAMSNFIQIKQWQVTIGGTYQPPLNTSIPEVNVTSKEITENDLPIIVGAALGGATGFVLLVASCVIILKATAKELVRDQVQHVETIQEDYDEETSTKERVDEYGEKKTKVKLDEVRHTKFDMIKFKE